MRSASNLLQAGQFEQARSVLENLVRAQPRFVEAHRLLAGALLALGDRQAAEHELRRAVAIDPRWAPAQVALGELLAENGNPAEAEAALRAANVNAGHYPRAALSLTRLLLQTGRAQQAHDTIAAHAQLPTADVDTVNEYARSLLVLQRNEEAAIAFERVVAARPADGLAAARLAGALAGANRFAEAGSWIQRAFALGMDQAEAWFTAGTAAMGEGRYDDACQAFRSACAREPLYADAQRELAQLIWMQTGDLIAASADLDAALQRHPDASVLLAIKASLHLTAGDPGGALALLETLAAAADAAPALLLTASEAALKAGVPGAIEFARRALDAQPDASVAVGMLGNALLDSGQAQEAEALALHALQIRPDDQGHIALLTTAQRLRGDLRYREICDYETLVRTWILNTPDGWPDLSAYLADLAASLRKLHTLHTHPLHQSLRHGTQTTRNLLRSDDPAIRAFFQAIDGPIRRHLEAIGTGNDPTRRRNNGRYRIHGIWSVQLWPNGYHTNHVHPEGWLSSACYIDLPPAVAHGHEGWLKFGEPGFATKPALAPERYVRPEPGLLALFPSHAWHGTVPFGGSGTRLTIAFDLVPG